MQNDGRINDLNLRVYAVGKVPRTFVIKIQSLKQYILLVSVFLVLEFSTLWTTPS